MGDVVFVHGLGGDHATTWRHGDDDSTSWPHWLAHDFPDVGVWSLGYAASPSKWLRILGLFSKRYRDSGHGMALPDRALEVLNLMVLRGLGRPLLFICHSLGGLVTKQLLRKSADDLDGRLKKVFTNTRTVLFLATPHAGAALASLADAFRVVFGATVTIQDLQAHDAHLRDLFDWYRHHAAQAGFRTASYFEQRKLGGVTIVNPTSAHPGVGDDPVGLDEDHISIAKPRSRESLVYLAASQLVRDLLLVRRPSQAPNPPPDLAKPLELPSAADRFFGREVELDQLTRRLRSAKNTAVVGPAGLGKTALAAEALRAVVGETPDSLAQSPYPDGVVYLDLYTLGGASEAFWDTLASRLAGPGFMERSTAKERATAACHARRILVVIEGGEEADGRPGRARIDELLSVLSETQNRRLLLTRLNTQAKASETVEVKEALSPEDAGGLFDSITRDRASTTVRTRALGLLEGHPLALTWAANLLWREDDDPERLLDDWAAQGLPPLSDPERANHTLEWLFERSVGGLNATARRALDAAGLLAHAPFPLAAIQAVIPAEPEARRAIRDLVDRSLWKRAQAAGWQFTHVLGYRFARRETGSDPEIRAALGRWLHRRLAEELATGKPQSMEDAIEHLGALLRTDDDQSLWRPLTNAALYEFRDRLRDLGGMVQVKLLLSAVEGWLKGFPPDKAQEPQWLRERSVLGNRQGDVLRDQGNLGGTLAAYRESLQLSCRLAESDPSNAGWQRDLSVSHNKVGDVLSDQGDLGGALAAYRESLQLIRRLAESDPSYAGWQRDLSVCHNNVGNVLKTQGNMGGAAAAYRESLQLRRRLAEADPSNAGWQRDLAVSQNKVGDVLKDQGDLGGALAAYRESLQLRYRLAEADPSNAVWQRDLSVSHNKVGDVLKDQGDLGEALAAYREALQLIRRLAESDPSNAVWQRDLGVSHEKVGDALKNQGDLGGALAAYRESLQLRRRLAEADPSNAVWQRDLSVTLMRVADSCAKSGERVEGLRLAKESLSISDRLAALDRTNATWQKDVAFARSLVARLGG